jgi:hypothetical protein
MIVAHQAPPLPFVPPEAYGRPAFGLLVTWAGDIAEGRRVLAPLLQVGKTLGELVRPVLYRAIQTLLDGSAAPGNGTLWRSVRLSQLSDAAIEDLVSLAESLPNRPSFLTGWMIGGAASRVAPDTTALLRRLSGGRGSGCVWPPACRSPERSPTRRWTARRRTADGHDRATPESNGSATRRIWLLVSQPRAARNRHQREDRRLTFGCTARPGLAQLAAPVVPGGPSSTVGAYSNSWSPPSKVRLSTRSSLMSGYPS